MFDGLADDHRQHRRGEVLATIFQGLQGLLQLLHRGALVEKAMGPELQAAHDEIQLRTRREHQHMAAWRAQVQLAQDLLAVQGLGAQVQ
ncbi:hypothetical protein D3C77_625110 [compost metagenome]